MQASTNRPFWISFSSLLIDTSLLIIIEVNAKLSVSLATMTKCLLLSVVLCVAAIADGHKLRHHHQKHSHHDDSKQLMDPKVFEDALPAPKGLSFVGSGYNLVKGNPDGQDLKNGGVDPGLLPAMRMLKLTYDKKRTSVDLKYQVPDQISFAPRESCKEEKTRDIIFSSKSYQDQLEISVKAEASYEAAVWGAAFTASAGYKKMTKDTSSSNKVFFENRKVCLKGNVRYYLSQLASGAFSVTEEFAAAACALPQSYDQQKYREFLDLWGTDVVVEAELGTKTVNRYECTSSEFTAFAMNNFDGSVSASGRYGGFSASVQVDVGKLSESMKAGSTFGSSEKTLTSGGEDLPEPISIKLMSITKLFEPALFRDYTSDPSGKCTNESLKKIMANVQKILTEYPALLAVTLPEDKKFIVPVTWPRGTYALPKPTPGGCPNSTNFKWNEGWIYQDTEDDDNINSWSKDNHLGIQQQNGDTKQSFCVKTTNAPGQNYAWPKGSYCIAKKGECAKGFKPGSVTWVDETDNNRDKTQGAIPEVAFHKDSGTSITYSYCCRDDGFPSNEIYLPTDKDFLLYKKRAGNCQQVSGMVAMEEFFFWDIDDSASKVIADGEYPYGEYTNNIKMFYCYYTNMYKTIESITKLVARIAG